MPTKYEYIKSPVDIGRLSSEVADESGITTTLRYCNFNGPNSLEMYFDSDISGGEQTLLDSIVTSHHGEPLPEPAVFPTGDLPGDMIPVSGGKGVTTWINASDIMYPVLGSNEYEASDEDKSTTTAASMQQKVRLELTDLLAGKYRVDWCYEWTYSNGNFQFVSRLWIDDDTYMEQEVRPVVGDINYYKCSSGFVYVNLTSGNHNIGLDYCSSKSGETAYIKRARVSARRVS